MSFWEANKTGERKNCYTLTASGPGADDLRKMLENAKVYDIEGDDGEEKRMFGLHLDSMTAEQAQQWFCAFQVADKHCPMQIICKIDGTPPKQPVSCTVFVSPQPICDKKKDCLKYAKEHDQRLNLATDQGKGALSGKKDHVQDRKLLTGSHFQIGDVGTTTVDFEGMYRDAKKKHDELLVMLKKYLAALVKRTGAPWVITLHKGNAMRRLVKAPHHSHCRLLKPGEFDPPAAGEKLLRQLGPGVSREPTSHLNGNDPHGSERRRQRVRTEREGQADPTGNHQGKRPPHAKMSEPAPQSAQKQNTTPQQPTQPTQESSTRSPKGGIGNNAAHRTEQKGSTQPSHDGPFENENSFVAPTSLDFDGNNQGTSSGTQAAAQQEETARLDEDFAMMAFEHPATDVHTALSDHDKEFLQQQMSGNAEEIVAQCGGHTLYREKLQNLLNREWLTDDVINCYMRLLAIRDAKACAKDRDRKPCSFFSSLFYTKLMNIGHRDRADQYKYKNVQRWSKKVPSTLWIIIWNACTYISCRSARAFLRLTPSFFTRVGGDLFALDKIFIPINQNNQHWTCVVVSVQEKCIRYYDSFGLFNREITTKIGSYLAHEHYDKKSIDLDVTQWTQERGMTTRQQFNGTDCGIFVSMYCDFLANGDDLAFTEEDMNRCRARMALSILKLKRYASAAVANTNDPVPDNDDNDDGSEVMVVEQGNVAV